MYSSSFRKTLLKAPCIVLAAATALALASSACYAQQRRQLFRSPPDNARTVWSVQGRHVASELELDREDMHQLIRAYISAKEEHLDKVEDLLRTRGSSQKMQEIRRDARSSLEKSLVEAPGENKGKKAGAVAEERILFEDRFDGKLADGWTWLRENPQAWRIREGALEIRVEPGVAHTVKNALLRPAPNRTQGKFAIEVTIHNTIKPTQQYEQAGITWYHDGKPVFKLVKELVDGKLFIIPGRKPMDSETVQLRLIVTADSFTAQFRQDAKGEFHTAATGRLPAPRNDQVSIQCYNGPPDAEHWIRFDNFRILQLPK